MISNQQWADIWQQLGRPATIMVDAEQFIFLVNDDTVTVCRPMVNGHWKPWHSFPLPTLSPPPTDTEAHGD